MLSESIDMVSGIAGLWDIQEIRARTDGRVLRRLVEPITFKNNQIQFDWGYIAAQTIGRGKVSYRLSALYIEFENVASPGDAVTIPSFTRAAGTEYYDDLQSSGSRDYLRVPLLQDPLISIASGFENYFTENTDGNKITIFAQTQGVVGVHGKTFSDSVNSKVFGAAAVATPVYSDPTQDIVFARTYFGVSEQTLKEASSQIGVSWEFSFK